MKGQVAGQAGPWGFPSEYLELTAGATLHCARSLEGLLATYPAPDDADQASVAIRAELEKTASSLRHLTALLAKSLR